MTDTTLDYQPKRKKDFDPDQYRMTIGEHLEELRIRMILALLGFGVAAAFCLFFGTDVMSAFCRPLFITLFKNNINPQIYYTQISDPFMVWIEVSMISAGAIASPWIVYQAWQFIAAGLYSNERKIVTQHVPLSITLLIAGMLFVYFLVLPWTIEFFLAFNIAIPLPTLGTPTTQTAAADVRRVPMLAGDPERPVEGQQWFNTVDGRLKMFVGSKIRVLQFGPDNLTAPIITLPDYIDLVFGMLLTFGLSFQLPLLVMALVAIGIVERDALKKARRYVYFGMSILAAAITPGDVITATIALMIPLCALYELGIWLSREKAHAPEASD